MLATLVGTEHQLIESEESAADSQVSCEVQERIQVVFVKCRVERQWVTTELVELQFRVAVLDGIELCVSGENMPQGMHLQPTLRVA